MTNEERLKAAGWQIALNAKDAFPAVWTHDGASGYTEDEALVVVLTDERDAAIARAERAEAQRDSSHDAHDELFRALNEALPREPGVTIRDAIRALRARAERAEAEVVAWKRVTGRDDHDALDFELGRAGIDTHLSVQTVLLAKLTARAEAAEALAASRPEITPEMADARERPIGTRLSREQRLADDCDAALRAHAAKVSR